MLKIITIDEVTDSLIQILKNNDNFLETYTINENDEEKSVELSSGKIINCVELKNSEILVNDSEEITKEDLIDLYYTIKNQIIC